MLHIDRIHARAFAAVALAGLLAACGGTEAETTTTESALVLAAADVVVASTETVEAGTVVTGTLEPYRVVEIRAQVPGVLVNLRVDRGDAVREGQTLARIEAQGIVGQAASARAAVASAEAGVALAQRQLESARKLHDAGAMSEIEFRQAETAYEASQAQLAAARAQALGANESARRATVTTPIAGEVSRRPVSEGEAVNPGESLLTVVNSSILEFAGQVPVDRAGGIHTGMPVEFSVDAYPGRTFRGSVARVEPTADATTRQVGVFVRLPNADRGLVGGVFATGRILTGGDRSVVVVPTPSVRGTVESPFVWVIRDGAAVKSPVTTGARDERRGVVEVVAGLNGGETVIVAPGEITEGARVEVASTTPAASREEV